MFDLGELTFVRGMRIIFNENEDQTQPSERCGSTAWLAMLKRTLNDLFVQVHDDLTGKPSNKNFDF